MGVQVVPKWFYSLIRRESAAFEPYTALPRRSYVILRARPVGPSELRSRAGAHGNRRHNAQEFLPAYPPTAPSGPRTGPPSEEKIPPMGVILPFFLRKNTPYASPSGWKSPAFGRKNTPYGAQIPEIHDKNTPFVL